MKKSLLLLTICCFNTPVILSQTWKELTDSIEYYYNHGDANNTISLGERLVLIKKEQKTEPDSTYGKILIYLGTAYSNRGEFAKAETILLESLRILTNTIGDDKIDFALVLNNLAEVYSSLGQYKKAESLYLHSGEILHKIEGDESSYYASSLDNLANLYYTLGELEKSKATRLKSLTIREKIFGKNHFEYAKGLIGLGLLHSAEGQYKKSEFLYLQAKEIIIALKEENNINYAILLNNLAVIYQGMGENENAESYFYQSANVLEKLTGEMHPYYAMSLNNIARFYERIGRYDKTEKLFLRSMEIQKKILGDSHPEFAHILNNMGLFYESIGQYLKAETFFTASLKIKKAVLGESHYESAVTLNNIGYLFYKQEFFEKAETTYLQASGILKNIQRDSTMLYAAIINNLGLVYNHKSQYDKAESLFNEAKNIRRKIVGENHKDYAGSLNNLAALYADIGMYRKAEPLYIQATEIYKEILSETHPDNATCLNNLGLLYMNMNEYDKAKPLLLKGGRIILQNLIRNFTVFSEREKQDYLLKKVSLLETNNSIVYNYHRIPALLKDNFNLQIVFKSLTLTDTRNLLKAVQQSQDTSVHHLFQEWQSWKTLLAKQYSLPVNNRRTDIAELETKAENLEKELSLKSSPFRDQQAATKIGLGEVQNKLQLDEVAVEFVSFRLYNKKWTDSVMYAAYVLTKKDSVPIFVPLFEERQLQHLLDSAGKTSMAMAGSLYRGTEIKSKSAVKALGKVLYNLVWAPLEPHLKGMKKVSYSPAGKLYGIAFHALPVDTTSFLMDKYELQQYTSSRQVVLRNKEEISLPKNITLFGNADFSIDSSQLATVKNQKRFDTVYSSSVYSPSTRGSYSVTWPDLPGTAEELKKINDLFTRNRLGATVYSKAVASEENLKSLSGNSPQILHIATHGFFLPEPDKKKSTTGSTYTLAEDPLLRSGLIMAGGNYAWSGRSPVEGAEDGIATAYEIAQLNLSNTELVVLSACETALGDVKGNEGVFGLQRAFKMAGVKKMIVSLWQVPDKETAELMTSFYSHWLKGKTIEEAFARAQAEMRKKYSPYYWAAFVLVE